MSSRVVKIPDMFLRHLKKRPASNTNENASKLSKVPSDDKENSKIDLLTENTNTEAPLECVTKSHELEEKNNVKALETVHSPDSKALSAVSEVESTTKSTGASSITSTAKSTGASSVASFFSPTKKAADFVVPLPEVDHESPISLKSLLIEQSWLDKIGDEFDKEYMQGVQKYLRGEYEKKVRIFPPKEEIFSVFNIIPLKKIRVVVIGQDPYHNVGQAHGLSFSVKKGIALPPSLKNIYKELANDIPGFVAPNHGYLVGWAQQGVFMLNASLTVKAHTANSHANIGWQKFTDHVIKVISSETKGVVFLLWGGFAQKKAELVDSKKHAVVKTAHPSPLSARLWWGCKCFSKTNELLKGFGKKPIDWNDL